MRNNTSSQTAFWVCFYRALATKSQISAILPDPIAEHFLPQPLRWLAQRRFMATLFKRLISKHPNTHRSSQILLRQRFAEDALAKSVAEQGVTQYIILGAGLDSFSVRKPALVAQLQVFELDHPATQAAKRRLLSQSGQPLPEQVHFVAIDFENERISERLLASNFDPNQKTYITWMGVSYYLHENTFWDVLAELTKTCRAGYVICFDYARKPNYKQLPLKKARFTRYFWRFVHIGMRIIGEPFRTLFHTEHLHEQLKREGFTVNDDLSVADFATQLRPEERGVFKPAGHTRIALASHP